MTISANYTYDLTADQIVSLAYQLVRGEEYQAGAVQLAFGRTLLNVGIKALQNEGVQLRTRTRYTQALSAGTAAYTAPADTIDILDGAFVSDGNGVDLPVAKRSMTDYMLLTNKSSQGQPTQMYVESGTSAGTVTFTLYQVPDSNWTSITYPQVRLLRDMDTGGVTGDFPSRYLKALAYMVAVDVAESSGLPEKVSRMTDAFEFHKTRALLDDGEKGPARFVPDYDYMRGWR